jgi:hypothetical protein
MNKRLIGITVILLWCFGCATANSPGVSDYSQAPSPTVATAAPKAVGASDLIFDPVAVDPSALPDLRDLPFPGTKKTESARPYTGIIKNKTKYEVSVPSGNSDTTLVIPPYGWIEYTAWTRKFNVTAYHHGKPFYCLKINAHPKNYAFMCSKYDFIAEIVKPVPVRKYKPLRKKRLKKRSKGDD